MVDFINVFGYSHNVHHSVPDLGFFGGEDEVVLFDEGRFGVLEGVKPSPGLAFPLALA